MKAKSSWSRSPQPTMKSIGARALRLRASISVASRMSETARIRIEAPSRSLNGAGSGHSRLRRRVTLERLPARRAIARNGSRLSVGPPIPVCLSRAGSLDGRLPLRLAYSLGWSSAGYGRSQLAARAEVGEQVRRPLACLAVERHQFGDHGVEARTVGVEGGGDAVVAIHNPILAAELDEIDWGQRLQALVGIAYALPAPRPILASERLEW